MGKGRRQKNLDLSAVAKRYQWQSIALFPVKLGDI